MDTPTSQNCDFHPERLSVDTLGRTVTADKLAVYQHKAKNERKPTEDQD